MRPERAENQDVDRVLAVIAGLPPVVVLTLVFVLPALESSTMLGLVIPGETAVLVGGVVAHSGALPLWAVIIAAVAGACVGDQIGYLLGRRYGPALLARLPAAVRRWGDMAQAQRLVTKRGAVAVVVGRWVAVLRALVPMTAGASGMPRGLFTRANVTGGLVWATSVALLGYFGAASYQYLERQLGIGGEVLFAVVIVAVLLRAWHHRRLRRQRSKA